jgi:hypothetical protein
MSFARFVRSRVGTRLAPHRYLESQPAAYGDVERPLMTVLTSRRRELPWIDCSAIRINQQKVVVIRPFRFKRDRMRAFKIDFRKRHRQVDLATDYPLGVATA